MINGVLTERTVEEVVPILQTNSDGLKKALEELVKQYKLKQDEMEKWKVRVLLFRSSLLHAERDLYISHEHTTDFASQKKNNVQVVQQPGQ
jgi:predicted alpha/beta hydrolase family esterase